MPILVYGKDRKAVADIMKATKKFAKSMGFDLQPSKINVRKIPKSFVAMDVLNVIKRSRKPIDIETLKKRTGFEGKNIHDIIYRLKKKGKIKSAERGKYIRVGE